MLNKSYRLAHAERALYNHLSTEGLGLILGSIIKVVAVEPCPWDKTRFGATSIEILGSVYTIDPHHPNWWCYFTEDMVDNPKIYGIVEFEGTVEVKLRNLGTMKSYVSQYGVKPLEDRYNEWVLENMHIYELFEKFTLQAINAGHSKISHWLIVNRIRWEVQVETKPTCDEDRDYKISNDYIAFIARDFIKDHPEHKDIFNLKQMKRV